MLTMFAKLFRNWWMLAIRGVFAIGFGLLALISPQPTIIALILLFGAFALTDGTLAVITGIAARKFLERWWIVLLEGITGIVIGLLTFFWPDITALALLYLIAAWAIVTGIFEIMTAIQLRRVISGEWLIILGGLLSTLVGLLLFVFPGAGAVTIMWLIGMYAIVAGIMELFFAFHLRGLWREFQTAVSFGA
jgi:uncharacterized membrane protein HdeD (DUF308 family)